MTNSRDDRRELLNLLIVFDGDYASDKDCEKLHGLDVNCPEDVAKAVEWILMPEFQRHTSNSQLALVNMLREAVSDSTETFEELFEQVSFVFDDEVADRQMFMKALLGGIDSAVRRRE